MKFLHILTKEEFDTSKHIMRFVDEYTGEIDDNRKCLDKTVRLLWFRSEHPKACIKTTVQKITSSEDLFNSQSVNNAEVLKYASTAAYDAVLATCDIYEEGNLLSSNSALRRSTDDFHAAVEAAQNAAVDRAIRALGYIVSEEIDVQPNPDNTPEKEIANNSEQKFKRTLNSPQSAVSEIANLLDEENSGDNQKPAENVNSENNAESSPCYDTSTSVEDILKLITKEDARAYVCRTNGKFGGKTVGEIYEGDKDANGFSRNCDFFANKYKGNDNILRAACILMNKGKTKAENIKKES